MRLSALALAAGIAAATALPASAAEPGPAAAPRVAPAPGPIIQMFQWPWDSIAAECRSTLGPQGIGAVQVSPPQEHVQLADQGHPWYQDYQPVSYQLNSRRGDREKFANMVRTCNDAGVQIYADAVLNHMSAGSSQDSGPGSGGSQYSKYDYPGLYQDGDFHGCRRDIADYNNPEEVRTCELVGLSDLKTESEKVRAAEIGYLNDLIGLGVTGFRIDGAKHMAPEDVGAITGAVRTLPGTDRKPYVFQEVIADQASPTSDYTGNGDVTEFSYHDKISEAFKNGSLAGLLKTPDEMPTPSDKAVVFVDNHDTQRSEPTLTYKDGNAYDLANAFMLAYPYGTPKLISSFAFDNQDAGPPADQNGMTKPANCDDGAWVCEQRHPMISGMIGFWRAVQGKALSDWWDDGGGRIAFGRQDRGFVALNREGGEWRQTLQTSLSPGVYCDVMHGSLQNGKCTGPTVQVYQDGKINVTVRPDEGVALHAGAKQS